MTVLFKNQALADLRGIRSYIAERNPRAALRMAQEACRACERLEMFPGRGRRGSEPGTRELTTVWPYVIVYRHSEGLLEILRIWRGRQNRG